jgi:FkbM family methyltransferase
MQPTIMINCPPGMAPHVQKVANGEYDLPYQHPNPIVLDIGANVGGFAAWASHRWPGSFIHCYEPLPENFAWLEKNLAPLGGRVQLNNFAIGDPAHTRMRLGLNNCGEGSFFDLGEQSSEFVEVTTKTPSVLPQAQILKLDAEGAEIEILGGLPEIQFDAIVLEYHSEANRRRVDELLAHYVLMGGEIRCMGRGVLKYMHRRLLAADSPFVAAPSS